MELSGSVTPQALSPRLKLLKEITLFPVPVCSEKRLKVANNIV